MALTRIVSAVFRKGGYFKPGGRFMPSLVAEIGEIIERHLTGLGVMNAEPDPHLQAWLAAKREQLDATAAPDQEISESGFPAGAQLCGKCHTLAKEVIDGCLTCLNCGDSKCG